MSILRSEAKLKPTKDMSDMALSATFVPDVPKDIIFPEELNTYLRDQIQCLTHENGMLKRNLSECETKLKYSCAEVQTLSKQVKQFEEAAPGNNFSTISNIASAKIVELSKKLREKCSELEVAKTKCSKLEHQIRVVEETPKTESTTVVELPKTISDQPDEIKQLQDKLSATNSKLFDAKNANSQLKNDLKLANKFLQSEVGESFDNLQSLTNSGITWRGRAEMVCDLQQKNAELKEKVKSLLEKLGPKPSEPPPPKSDKRIEALSKENLTLKSEIQELKRKLDGGKARLKVYENENSTLKGKISVINEQQDNDRNLIATLTGQLSTIRNIQNDEGKRKDQIIIRLQKEVKELKCEVSKEKCRAENLVKDMEDKVAEIDNLKNGSITFRARPQSSVSTKGVVDERSINRLEAERLRLLELTKIANGRLDAERRSLANLQMQLKTEKQKNAKLESKVARLELDKCDRNSVYRLGTNRSKDKDKDVGLEDKLELAEENIKTLQTRLEIEQKERQMDFQEFSKILQNYAPKCN